MVVGQPVGVVGQGGLLRQRCQAGEQGGAGVDEQVVVNVGDAAGAGEFERQQGQQPADGGNGAGTRVAGGVGQGGQVQGDQVGDGQQQAGHGGVATVGEGGEVEGGGRGQVGVAAGGGDRGGRFGGGVAQQAAEPFFGEDLRDAGAVERGAFTGQVGGDLVGGQPLPA